MTGAVRFISGVAGHKVATLQTFLLKLGDTNDAALPPLNKQAAQFIMVFVI